MLKKTILTAMVLFSAVASHAQPYTPPHVTGALPGWQCMALAAAYSPKGSYAPPAPVYAGPQPGATRVGGGAGVIIVPDPLKPQNGRTVMIWPNGRKVWIDVNLLTSWHQVSNPAAKCHPIVLSNGRYGWTATQ